MQIDLVKSYQFEAAHVAPCGGGASGLHGHSYRVELVVRGACDPHLGWLMDYGEITKRFEDIYAALDHRTLNDVDGLHDTSLEGVAAWIRDRMLPKIEGLKDVHVSILGLGVFRPETVDADPLHALPARIRFGFEAAHALPNVPAEHKCRRMHGHSFQAEVGGAGAGDLAATLKSIYNELDHRCLNDIEGLENPTSEQVSRWIWDRLDARGAGPSVVAVAETCTARCIYYGKRA